MKLNITKEPWDIKLEDRLKKIINCSERKVIYLYEKVDTSTFRYRAYNPCQALEFSSMWKGSYFFENELSILEKYLKLIDVVVFCRVSWSPNFDIFFHKVKKYNIPTVYDVDDLVFNIETIPILMNSLAFDFSHNSYYYLFSYSARVWMMGNMCDYTFGTNKFLCEQLSKTFKKQSFEINNFLNKEQILVSEKLYQKKLMSTKKDSNYKIGYFSGTPSHKNDFGKIVSELIHLLDIYSEITLEVVGFMEFPKNLNNHINNKRVIFTPLVDFLTLQEKIANVDLNIAPLMDNIFTNCKSELKFFEAAIVGTITCATPTFTFKENIQHGLTGYLCEDGEWFETLENIFKAKKNPSMITAAKDYCLKKYSPETQCGNIEKALNALS